VVAFTQALATSFASLGDVQRLLGHPTESTPSFEQAIAIQERLAAEHPDIAEYKSDLGVSYHGLGRLLKTTRDRVGALSAWRKAENCLESLDKPTPYELYTLGCVLALSSELITASSTHKTGDIDGEARKLGDRAVALVQRAVAAGYSDVAQIEKDSDLDAIRSRNDFKAIVGKLRAR
jgi:hypothetical protein